MKQDKQGDIDGNLFYVDHAWLSSNNTTVDFYYWDRIGCSSRVWTCLPLHIAARPVLKYEISRYLTCVRATL